MNNMLKRIMFTLIIAIPIILIACNKSNVNKLNNNILKSSVQSIQEPNEISTEKESYNESYIEESNESRQSYDYKEESKIVNKNLLILGIDARGNEPARADTIILINMKNDRINFISIPRDTMITLGRRGKQKINASYAYGGVKLCKESVEKLLDTKIHNYLVVNFKAIQKGVDALGGFTVTIPKTIKIKDPELKKCFTLKKGQIKLNGIQTLQYLRYRSDGRGDIGRIYRQQQFIKDLQDSFLKLENVPLIPKTYLAIKDDIKTDMNSSNMASYFISGYRLRNNFQFYTLEGYSKMIDKVSYYVLYKSSINKVKELLK
ncbi:MAG: LCP family protein [Clostridiales bacterium]|nr:LCP family protein [Clostridiales bacterium]